MKYVYTVWMRDLALSSDDPDYEWPACFIVDGTTDISAKAWGDCLAERYAKARGQCLISSEIEALEGSTLPGVDKLPTIQEGEDALDGKIGW